MKKDSTTNCPSARTDAVIVEPVGDGIVVYDLKRHRAHALNRSAAALWRLCDGTRTVPWLSQELSRQMACKVTESDIEDALHDLYAVRLFIEGPPFNVEMFRSRRRALKKSGQLIGLTVALPIVLSLRMPRVADAASMVACW
jgi:hypothetical protein